MLRYKIINVVTAIITTFTVTSSLAEEVEAKWKENDSGWWFEEDINYAVGWKMIDNKWYYFDNNGYMKTGWIKDDGYWYFMYDSGELYVGELYINGKHYYMATEETYKVPLGAMLTNTNVYGKYYGEDGVRVEDTAIEDEDQSKNKWKNDEHGWRYKKQNSLAIGWNLIDDKWYYFDNNGYMKTGWINNNNNWYYLKEDGELYSGKLYNNGKYYYLADNSTSYKLPQGAMVKNKTIDDIYFGSEGYAENSWIKDESYWYYACEDGTLCNGSLYNNGKYYYMATDSSTYGIPKGAMVTDMSVEGEYYGDDGSKVVSQSQNQTDVTNVDAAEAQYAKSVSDDGIKFICEYEGFSSVPYHGSADPNGIITIGYGHVLKSGETFDSISKEEALTLMKSDLSDYVNAVNNTFGDTLNQNEFDALVSFTYNLGAGIWSNDSKLKRDLKQKASPEVLKEDFVQYCHSNGKYVQGLYNRRLDEWEMYLNGDYKRSHF